jgi:hypothetical protein
MSKTRARGRLPLALAVAALTFGSAGPAIASDPPEHTARADRVKKENRYCIHRHKAGAAAMEKYCKTRKQWIRQDGVDPSRRR